MSNKDRSRRFAGKSISVLDPACRPVQETDPEQSGRACCLIRKSCSGQACVRVAPETERGYSRFIRTRRRNP